MKHHDPGRNHNVVWGKPDTQNGPQNGPVSRIDSVPDRPGDIRYQHAAQFVNFANGRHHGQSWRAPNGAAWCMREAALRFRYIIATAIRPNRPA